MDFIERFNNNLAKIDALKASFYEKDLIFSAYYSHLNGLEISAECKKIMQKYGISFDYKRINISMSNNQYETLSQIDIEAKKQNIEIDKILFHSKETLKEILTPNELTYNLISNLITSLEQIKIETNTSLEGYMVAFLENFDKLKEANRMEILQKSHKLIERLIYCYDMAIKLCIKILSIRANKVLDNQGLINYTNAMVEELRRYISI